MRLMSSLRLPLLALAAVLLACLSACGSAPKSRPDMPIIRVQVVNDQGEPLKGIRATATRSEVSEDGRVVRFLGEPRRVGPSDKDGFINLVGRDPREGDGPMEWEIDDRTKESYGYRVSLWGKDVLPTNLSARFSSFPRRLEVKTPVEVYIRLDGETVKGKPKIAVAEKSSDALTKKPKSEFKLKKEADGLWKVRLKSGTEYVIGWIAGEKMYGYLSPPFKATKDQVVSFSPGLPASVEYTTLNVPGEVHADPFQVELLRKAMTDKEPQFIAVPGKVEVLDGVTTCTIEKLAGGEYKLTAKYVPPFGAEPELPYLADAREITVEPGQVNQVEAIHPIIDREVEEGDVAIRGSLMGTGGVAIPKGTIQLRLYDDEGKLDSSIYYDDVKVDEEGKFEFTGLSPKYSYLVSSPDAAGTSVQTIISKDSFKENDSVEVTLMVGVSRRLFRERGTIEDLALTYADGTTGTPAEFDGKTVVVLIWTGWNKPSRAAMARLDKQAAIKRDRDDLLFLGLSIDSGEQAWKQTLKDVPTPSVKQAWFNPKDNAERISEVLPYYLIIDQHGIVKKLGADVDVENELLRMGYRPKKPDAPVPAKKK
jgi:hypothetical protein